jgi:hypothetical protein
MSNLNNNFGPVSLRIFSFSSCLQLTFICIWWIFFTVIHLFVIIFINKSSISWFFFFGMHIRFQIFLNILCLIYQFNRFLANLFLSSPIFFFEQEREIFTFSRRNIHIAREWIFFLFYHWFIQFLLATDFYRRFLFWLFWLHKFWIFFILLTFIFIYFWF